MFGLIPAHAGKTWPRNTYPPRRGAHPRSRGENDAAPRKLATDPGSSPLTRGKQLRGAGFECWWGLIPAHAGKTSSEAGRPINTRAHPRSRGENVEVHEHGVSPTGLIPAHAGKTPVRLGRHQDGRAHPRSRGENTASSRRSMARAGSSPLTRGKLHVVVNAERGHGLIPAHAGKTMASAVRLFGLKAHPRSRGENKACEDLREAEMGSSPLTRGKPSSAP